MQVLVYVYTHTHTHNNTAPQSQTNEHPISTQRIQNLNSHARSCSRPSTYSLLDYQNNMRSKFLEAIPQASNTLHSPVNYTHRTPTSTRLGALLHHRNAAIRVQ